MFDSGGVNDVQHMFDSAAARVKIRCCILLTPAESKMCSTFDDDDDDADDDGG